MMKTDLVQQFLQDFTRWAGAQPDLIALALVGSYARAAASEESDVDLVLLASDPRKYLDDRQWIRLFGTVRRQQEEKYGPLTSIRVWYENGLEVEFGVTSESWAALPLDPGTRQVMEGGIRVLFERWPILSRHLGSK
jgi:hypothetical protein